MSSPGYRIDEVTAPSREILDAVNRLLPQLSSSASPLDESSLDAIVASDSSHLLVARGPSADPGDGGSGRIVGSLTLVLFRIPTGVRAWIEDVVVDEAARGAGIGEQLVAAAVALARDRGARNVDLTSRPSRTAAHRLYLKSGFATRETAVYRLDIGE